MNKKILDDIVNSYMGKPQIIPPKNDTYIQAKDIGNTDIMKYIRNLLKGDGSGAPPAAAMQPYRGSGNSKKDDDDRKPPKIAIPIMYD